MRRTYEVLLSQNEAFAFGKHYGRHYATRQWRNAIVTVIELAISPTALGHSAVLLIFSLRIVRDIFDICSMQLSE